MLYIQLKKALHGPIQVALTYWKLHNTGSGFPIGEFTKREQKYNEPTLYIYYKVSNYNLRPLHFLVSQAKPLLMVTIYKDNNSIIPCVKNSHVSNAKQKEDR